MCFWETFTPFRTPTLQKQKRWLANLVIVIINSLMIRLIFSTAAVGSALWAQKNQIGLFNYLQTSLSWSFFPSIVFLDCTIYFQHYIFHKIPFLWRVHRSHHTDLDLDFTTALRFHPIEIAISMLIKMSVVVTLGVSPIAIIVFEIILNVMAMFNHANIHLSNRLDFFLRFFIVTPNMHNIHHSIILDETNSNYGFNLSWWDRLFYTYKTSSQFGEKNIIIGLSKDRDPQRCNTIKGILLTPFK